MRTFARPRWRPVTALAALAACAVVAPGSATAAAEQVVLSVGHTDAVDVHFVDGALSLRVRDDTGPPPPVSRDPADVTFQALPQSAIEVPDDPRFSFLGEPGSTVWVLPQVQQEDLLWPGWNTTQLASGVFAGDQVTMRLMDVDGPGELWVFMVDPFGEPLMQFQTPDGLPDALTVPVHIHAHANWAFSALGTYTLTFQIDATLANGTPVSTGPVPYRFVVGDLPDPQPTLSIQGLAAGYTPGQQVGLRAVQTPPGALTSYRWDRKCTGDNGFTEIAGETAADYQFTATTALNGCQYQARLIDGETTVATAPAVTLIVAAADPGASQLITVTLDDSQGALVISVDPNDRTVALPPLALSPGGDKWESVAALRPVRVTDTRPGKPGWNATGRVPAGFTSASGGFLATHLGWTPQILSQAPNQSVTAGPAVVPLLSGGTTGLSASCVLASAAAGAGRGTASLGANLTLQVPTETAGGSYRATLVLTII